MHPLFLRHFALVAAFVAAAAVAVAVAVPLSIEPTDATDEKTVSTGGELSKPILEQCGKSE